MADSRSHPTFSPHRRRPDQLLGHNIHSKTHRKPFTRVICKSAFFILFLIAIPLFPSEAPSFINQALITKFWEIIHLLFIGVAVSYGLFSSRNADGDFLPTDFSNFDDLQSSSNFVSRIFHVAPIFEDGYESFSGSAEKNVYQSLAKNGSENFVEHDENSCVQAWSSQYALGESVTVLSQVNYELRKPSQVVGRKLLGLPIRSLNSRVKDVDSSQFSDGGESDSSFVGGSSSSGRSVNEKSFGDMGPINLEERFNESFGLNPRVPRRSRSERVEMSEKFGRVVADRPSHFRPLSVDETQFASMESQSFRSTNSFSSRDSSISTSPTMLSPSHLTSSDSSGSRTEELGKTKDFVASYPLASQSPQTTKTRGASLNAFHLRKYGSGSLFQKDLNKCMKIESKDVDGKCSKNESKDVGGKCSKNEAKYVGGKSLKDELKDVGGKRQEGLPSSKERGQGYLESVMKQGMMAKAAPKGKSVRTIKSGLYTAEASKAGETSKTQIDDQSEKGYNQTKTVNTAETEMKREGFGNISNGASKKNFDTRYDMPKPTFGRYQMKEKKEPLENVTLESEEDSQSETTDKSRVSSGEDTVLHDAGDDISEVDRKAGEFIAKFREQIRLQKVASVERSKGLRLSGKYLR